MKVLFLFFLTDIMLVVLSVMVKETGRPVAFSRKALIEPSSEPSGKRSWFVE